MLQKNKIPGGDEPPKQDAKTPKSNPLALAAAAKAKALLDKIDDKTATKARRGHWEYCCGVKHWVDH